MRSTLPFPLRLLLVLAVSSLVLNDVARMVFPQIQQTLMLSAEKEKQDGNNATTTLFEEEVKHKTFEEQMPLAPLAVVQTLDPAIAHRITDDDVRHLAYLAIFTPPPDRA